MISPETLRELEKRDQMIAQLETANATLYDAVRYVLDRRQTDPDVGYYISLFTESFERLCRAEATHLGQPVEEVKQRRCKDLQPEYSKRKARVVELREELDRARLDGTEA